ncbi:MAG: carboxypeptidase regulatory-like domain-containing protein [Bradymonadales bacterium]|jgi:hypothetical protein
MNKILRFILIAVVLAVLVASAFWLFHFNAAKQQDTQAAAQPKANIGSFAGRVIDKVSGRGIANATLRVSDKNSSKDIVTDAQGNFFLEAPGGVYTLAPTAEAYVARGRDDQWREVAIVNDTKFVNAALYLQPAATLHGRVLAGSSPISANIVMEYHEDASGAKQYIFASTRSDEAGEFTISDAYEGEASLKINASGFALIVLHKIKLRPGQTTDLGDIPLLEGASLYGQVVSGATGQGIAHAQLAILDQNEVLLTTTRSDSAGNYRFEPVTTKEVELRVRANAFAFYEKSINFGQSVELLQNIEMQATQGLVLNVYNQTQRLPRQTDIIIRDTTLQSVVYESRVEDGRLELNEIEGGPFIVEARSPDGESELKLRATLGSEINVILKPLAKIIVSVHNEDGTLPAGEYKYSYAPNMAISHGATESPWQSFTAPSFEINDLKEGDYLITVRDAEMDVAQSPITRIRLGEQRALSLVIQKPSSLHGKVITSDGHAIHAKVERVGDAQEHYTDHAGNFVIGPLYTRDVSIIITPMNKISQRFDNVKLNVGSVTNHEFKLQITYAQASDEPAVDEIVLPPEGENWEAPIPESDDGMEFSI